MPLRMYSTIHLLEIMRLSAFKSPLIYPSSQGGTQQGSVMLYKKYMECRLLPSLRDFGHVGVLCNSVIYQKLTTEQPLSRRYNPPITAQINPPPPSRPIVLSSSQAGEDAVLGQFSTAFGLWGHKCTFLCNTKVKLPLHISNVALKRIDFFIVLQCIHLKNVIE